MARLFAGEHLKRIFCGERPLKSAVMQRIVGGVNADPGSWPWMVSIQSPGFTGYNHFCGGSLIKDQWVLTAAHCFNDLSFISKWRIVIGGHQLSQLKENVQIRSVGSYVLHKKYSGKIKINDVALIKLNKPVQYDDFVQPACLPSSTQNISSMVLCYVSGWGLMDENADTTADILQEAKVSLIDREICNKPDWYKGRVLKQNICAGHDKGGIDSCQGDSGGPLMCLDKTISKYVVVGVTSWGAGCARKQRPGVYACTKHFLNWIFAKLAGCSAQKGPAIGGNSASLPSGSKQRMDNSLSSQAVSALGQSVNIPFLNKILKMFQAGE
ncbi:acrosin-like [Mantella aurantiaca]